MPGGGRVEPDRGTVGVDEAVGGVGGVQVEVDHPFQRRLPHRFGEVVVGGGGGVGADQVVHPVAAEGVPVEQAVVLQGAEGLARLGLGQAGEGRGGGQVDVRTGCDAQQREHRPLLFGEAAQGPGQHGGQAGGRVGVVVEHLQAQVAEFGCELRERDLRVEGNAAGGDRQRQRVTSAQPDQLVGHLGLGGHPLLAEACGQQGTGFAAGEHVQGQVASAVPVDQGGRPGAAGDQHRAGGAAGQQRDDLVGSGGVVQHDQHPPPGHQTPVLGGQGVRYLRLSAGVDAQGGEESAQRVGRVGRPSGGAEPVQVDEQLPVGKPVGVPVRPGQGEPGLADPAQPADGRDHHRPGRRRVLGHRARLSAGTLAVLGGGGRDGGGQRAVQLCQLGEATGEQSRRGGQLAGHHR